MKPFSSLIITLSSFMTITMIQSTACRNLINSTCSSFAEKDPNIAYAFCTTSLQSASASQCATLDGLGLISIQLVHDNISDTHHHIKHMMASNIQDPYVRQCLADCFDLFSDAIPSAEQAMVSYKAKRFNVANVQISSVMDAATTCEDGFKEKKHMVSPLKKRNDDLFQLSAMALSAMDMIQPGSG